MSKRPSYAALRSRIDQAVASSEEQESMLPLSAALGGSAQAPSQASAALLKNFKLGPNLVKQALGPGGQQPQHIRQKDKFVPLPTVESMDPIFVEESALMAESSEFDELLTPERIASDGQILSDTSSSRGRITSYCISERLDLKRLSRNLSKDHSLHAIHKYDDVVHLHIETSVVVKGDIFFFEYGTIICWKLDEDLENEVVEKIARPCQIRPYEEDEIEIDEFQFNCSANEPPNIQNDTITINRRQAADHRARLAISHALAQSTKLFVYEERIRRLVEDTKNLPHMLARTGRTNISEKKVAQLIGKVFLQSSTVNLLSTVLDTPEFFRSAPDSLQALYERACEYLELKTRVDVLNARFEVLQEMLDMLRDQQNDEHGNRIEFIVAVMLSVQLVLMIFQLLSLFGFLDPKEK